MPTSASALRICCLCVREQGKAGRGGEREESVFGFDAYACMLLIHEALSISSNQKRYLKCFKAQNMVSVYPKPSPREGCSPALRVPRACFPVWKDGEIRYRRQFKMARLGRWKDWEDWEDGKMGSFGDKLQHRQV